MRKIIASEYIALDGVVDSGWDGQEPAIGPVDRLTGRYFTDEEVGKVVGSLTGAADTLLLGRVTFEGFAGFFRTRSGEMADRMNSMAKVVVSSTLDSADWQNSTLVSGDVAGQITELKHQQGGNINVSGSATLVRWLLRQGLLDELHLLVFPVVLGAGKRLFPDGSDPVPLKLLGSQILDCGVQHVTYAPAERDEPGL
jgi:dihydrofolate reductase